MNRREFVTRAGTASLGLAAMPGFGVSAAAPQSGEAYDQAMPDMLVSYLSKETNNLCAEWDRKRAAITTADALEQRNKFVRQKFIELLGGFPEKTPLDPITVRILKRDGYRIEVFMYQSRPNFWVTASLYVPTTGSGPFPGIISPCGHYPLGRMIPTYQTAYLSLVKSGFVVLAYDPIGQGERRQFWNPETGADEVPGGPTTEHSMHGQLLLLMGENLTQYRVWDGMRAIDYLQTRPEVDPHKIGCAGHSGGGTLTRFISAADERVQCAVVHEGGTANRWPVHIVPFSPVGPSDVEQNIFGSAIYGMDSVDLQISVAPRPLLNTIEHYAKAFDDAADKIRAGYRLLGVPEKFSTVSADSPHCWAHKLRLATADWFSRWFYGRPGPTSEPALVPEQPEDLYCTPDGSIRYSQQGETICSLILKKQAQLPPASAPPKDSVGVASYRDEMGGKIRDLLHYRKSDQPLSPRATATVPEVGYKIEKLEFLSEPGIYLPTWVYVPVQPKTGSNAILYFSEGGKDADGMEFAEHEASGTKPGTLAQLARSGHYVVAVDVRGIGETAPAHGIRGGRKGDFGFLFDVETAFAYMCWFMNRSLLGMRVQDVTRSVDYALSRPEVNSTSVHVIGKGMGALWAMYAAALEPRIQAVVCHEGLLSYRSLTGTDRYLHGADVFILDVLHHFDLPQVAAAVADRRLVLLSPLDAMKDPADLGSVHEAYRWTRDVYAAAGAEKQFQIATLDPDQDLAAQYLSLLGAS